MAKNALVLCNGEPPSRSLARRLARDAAYVVAADGGANVARAYRIRPDAIIGDLDSITPATRRFFSSTLFLHVSRQDNTDLEKALDFLATQHFRDVVITGIAGKRVDFTLANFSVLWNYTALFTWSVVGDGWQAFPVGKGKRMKAALGATVSLIPFGECKGITLKGLEYSLTNASMNVGRIGVSNVVRSSPFTVRVREGNMLMFVLDRKRR